MYTASLSVVGREDNGMPARRSCMLEFVVITNDPVSSPQEYDKAT